MICWALSLVCVMTGLPVMPIHPLTPGNNQGIQDRMMEILQHEVPLDESKLVFYLAIDQLDAQLPQQVLVLRLLVELGGLELATPVREDGLG